jgi:DNA-binding HxlR family transcriptional regulator
MARTGGEVVESRASGEDVKKERRSLKPASPAPNHSESSKLENSLPHLDRIIHERMRLGIVSALAVNESLTFNELKKLLQTTDGNLSVHARRLEEVEYVACTKSFEGRMPKTEYRLTPTGRRAFERYLNHMEALIQAMREGS